MGVFSEIAMEQQNGMFDSSAAFEDDEPLSWRRWNLCLCRL